MEKSIAEKLKRQLILFLARRLPPCKTIVALASEARERPLMRREKITLKLHLFTCEACRRYIAQIERISEILKSETQDEFSASDSGARLSEEARNRIKAVLQTADGKN